MRNIALIGKARSGKDTVAAELVAAHHYTRVAFADPLKEMALRVDPIVSAEQDARLAEIVDLEGWEHAKDSYPEVRRILQHLGQAVREMDEDFWLNVALDKVRTARRWNLPVVITDVRYANEASALEAEGFRLVRIVRPSQTPVAGAEHASETTLDRWPVDLTIENDSSLEYLKHVARYDLI